MKIGKKFSTAAFAATLLSAVWSRPHLAPPEGTLARNGRVRSRLGFFALALLVFPVVTAACSGDDPAEGGVVWEEPAWMTTIRLDREDRVTAFQSCLAEFGLEADDDLLGGVSVLTPVPEPPGWTDLLFEAFDQCTERIGFLEWDTLPHDEDAYQRLLDVRDCLIAHGHEVSEAPSFEVWREDVLIWVPHGEILDQHPGTGDETSEELWQRMNAECPQSPGTGMSVSW